MTLKQHWKQAMNIYIVFIMKKAIKSEGCTCCVRYVRAHNSLLNEKDDKEIKHLEFINFLIYYSS
jgi:hypothetical protein